MFEINPYSCTKPRNLFIGYEDLRQDIINGLFQTRSYAIIGGRRSGKTSILFQLLKDINEVQNIQKIYYYLIPRYFDIQSLNTPITVVSLFEKIYKIITSEFDCSLSWSSYNSNTICSNFMEQIELIKSNFENKYGRNWIIVLLIDELDSAYYKLNDMQFFENLRSILMNFALSHHFCIVATGVKGMDNLIEGSSPLNNLRVKYLNVLDEFSAKDLIKVGFHNLINPLPDRTCDEIIKLTGGHPFLMQGLLEKIWDKIKKTNDYNIQFDYIIREFINEHRDFSHWVKVFSKIEHAVYKYIYNSYDQFTNIDDIVSSVNKKETEENNIYSKIESALQVLLYHGLIIQNQHGQYKIAGTMFRDWYIKEFNNEESRSGVQDEDINMSSMIRISGCDNENRRADIIFVHGLDGDARATWHPKDRPDAFWPTWLGEDVPAVGVWSLGYAVSASAWKGHAMPLADRATNILDLLELDGIGRRPVVFIGHSLGGLLVKQLLRHAGDFGNPAWKAIATQTKAIVFLSTPHSGVDLASWIQYIGGLLRTTVSVEELEAHHPRLRELNAWYRGQVANLGIKTLVYCEKRPVAGILVVNETTADPGIGGVIPVPMDEDHVSICKPASKDSQIYRRVKGLVEEIITCRCTE